MLQRDLSVSAITAGFLAVLISYAGPLLIYFQAAQSAHASPEMLASWVWAISIGAGVSGIALSWRLKAPIVTAWSAPGTALLITLFPHLSLNEAIGAYITAGAIVLAIGLSGSFDALMRHIPKGVAAGMMAGILFQFGAKAFKAVETLPVLTLCMIAAFLVFKRWRPRYHMLMVLALGIALAAFGPFSTPIPWSQMPLSLTVPVFIQPAWSWASTLSLAIPLVVVSLSGQYLPGMAILKLSGYEASAKPIITATSAMSFAVACFGGITIVIAAITAALCTGKDAHEDSGRRYIAGIANGVFYLIGGMLAGTIVALFASLPRELVAVLAGLALIGAITSNIMGVVGDAEHREASMITFLATASGMSYLGFGSAFWGVVIGMLAYVVLRRKPAPAPLP